MKKILQNKKILGIITLIVILSGIISSSGSAKVEAFDDAVIGVSNRNSDSFLGKLNQENKINLQLISPEEAEKNLQQEQLEKEIKIMTENYPLEEMASFIAKYDRRIAALIVGIAKKESNWGKRSPAKNGKTCYNYWGYKGAGKAGKALGHGCFATAEEAVSVIGKRIKDLDEQGLDTPAKMIIWKCGRSCAGHSDYSVKKWISDVDLYYNKIAMK